MNRIVELVADRRTVHIPFVMRPSATTKRRRLRMAIETGNNYAHIVHIPFVLREDTHTTMRVIKIKFMACGVHKTNIPFVFCTPYGEGPVIAPARIAEIDRILIGTLDPFAIPDVR